MNSYIESINLDLVSNQTLAFIGDSVYDVYIRSYLAARSNLKTGELHKEAIKFVSAKAQSKVIEEISKNLTEEEIEVYKRGRNSNIKTVSKNVDVVNYKKATGFECLIGWLYITKKMDRLSKVIDMAISVISNK
ncbi:MAG: Mini-ribonuclease 3 [Clostridia bacterium]|nr:Mini-ribonuclease 3 [Clostridia bacterium]